MLHYITAALKDKGNEAFAREDYETAVRFYSGGLAELKDMLPLYTNRAQVNKFSLYFSMQNNFILRFEPILQFLWQKRQIVFSPQLK